MKPNEWLFDAIGCVEDSFLDQTEKVSKSPKIVCISAACLCILVLVGAILWCRLSENALESPPCLMENLVEESSVVAQVLVTKKEHTLAYSPIDKGTTYFTDYTVTVLEDYFGSVSVGESIVVRTVDGDVMEDHNSQAVSPALSDVNAGAVLLVFLNQPSVDSNNLLGKGNIFYPTDLNRGVFTVDGKMAICMNDGSCYQINDLIEKLALNAGE